MFAPTWLHLTRRWLRPPRTLGDAYAARDDNFLVLRLLAALMVMWSHSYVLSGSGGKDWIARLNLGPKVTAGSMAVDLFFLTSGLLVTGSYVERPQLWRFVLSRLLRILPALAVCVVLCALVLGPLVTELPARTYLQSWQTYRYMGINLSFRPGVQWGLPGVFGRNPYPGVVNGSLWSLPGEVAMYIAVAVLGVACVLRQRWLATGVIGGLVMLGWWAPATLPFVPGPWLLRPCGFFAVGALCFLHRQRLTLRTDVLLAMLAAVALTKTTAAASYFLAPTVIYLWLWLAYRPRLRILAGGSDVSYGLYLWGFPAQQIAAHIVGATSSWMNLLIALPFALAAATLSWLYAEKPALSFRR